MKAHRLLIAAAIGLCAPPVSAQAATAPPTVGRVPGIAHPFSPTAGDTSDPTLAAMATRGASVAATPRFGTINSGPVTHQWLAAGHTGKVKIGVIDFFSAAMLTTEAQKGELPTIPATHRKCLSKLVTCTFGPSSNGTHGNAIAEIITDEAPGAELFLAEAGSLADYKPIIDWFAANGVKIINHSLVGSYDGPGNGTGQQASIIDYAVSKGIAWFTSAGDGGKDSRYRAYQGSYERLRWSDPDGDRWLNFTSTDETLGTYCGALMGLRWSDWGAGRTDYELWAGDVNITTRVEGAPVLVGDRNQAAGATPIEGADLRWLCNTSTARGPVYDKNGDGFVHLKVRRSLRSTAASATGDVMELAVVSGWFEYSSESYSAGLGFADTKNPGAATVGLSLPSSGRGPTNDGRTKPDLVTIDCAATLAYGPCGPDGFSSSDAATARATGAAAVVLGALGPMRPAQLVQYLRNNANYAGGTASLPNNRYGWGDITLRGSGPSTDPVQPSRYMPEVRRLLDTRVPNPFRTDTTPVARNGAVRVVIDNRVPPLPTRTVVLNVTVVNTLGAGAVQVLPAGTGVPLTGAGLVAQRAGQTLSAMVVSQVGDDNSIIIHTTTGGHLLVDQLGIFDRNLNDLATSGYVPVDPLRVADSRSGGTPVAAGGKRTIKVAGRGITGDGWASVPPTGVSAVAVSVTADTPAASGWLAAGAVGAPLVSPTVYVSAGVTGTGTAIVPVSTSGTITLTSSVATHYQVDVLGWFGQGVRGGMFTPVQPRRVVDSRAGGAAPPPAGTVVATSLSAARVPSYAAAFMGTLTSLAGTVPVAFKLGRTPAAAARTFRSASAGAGQSVAVGVIGATTGATTHVVGSAPVHRTLDVAGWFSTPSRIPAGSISIIDAGTDSPVGAAASLDGRYVAYGTSPFGPLAGGIRLVDRQQQTSTVIPLPALAGQLGWQAAPKAVSSDGQRILFESAGNVTADDPPDVVRDHFVVDRSNGNAVTRVSRTSTGGSALDGSVQWSADLTRFVFAEHTGVSIREMQRDLSADAPVVLTGAPNGLFNSTLTAAIDGNTVWRRDAAPLSFDATPLSVSPDARYVLLRSGPLALRTYSVHDTTLGTTTPLCTGWNVELDGVDWSSGPPVPGDWCTRMDSPGLVRVLSAAGLQEVVLSWNGLLVGDPQVYGRQVLDGAVLINTSATTLSPTPGIGFDMAIFDDPAR